MDNLGSYNQLGGGNKEQNKEQNRGPSFFQRLQKFMISILKENIFWDAWSCIFGILIVMFWCFMGFPAANWFMVSVAAIIAFILLLVKLTPTRDWLRRHPPGPKTTLGAQAIMLAFIIALSYIKITPETNHKFRLGFDVSLSLFVLGLLQIFQLSDDFGLHVYCSRLPALSILRFYGGLTWHMVYAYVLSLFLIGLRLCLRAILVDPTANDDNVVGAHALNVNPDDALPEHTQVANNPDNEEPILASANVDTVANNPDNEEPILASANFDTAAVGD